MVIEDNLLSHDDNINYIAIDNNSSAPENVYSKTMSMYTKPIDMFTKHNVVRHLNSFTDNFIGTPVVIVEFIHSNFTFGNFSFNIEIKN